MKKILASLVILIIVMNSIVCVWGNLAMGKNETEKYLDYISQYQEKTIDNPTYGTIGGEWTILGLSRYGTISKSFRNIYLSNLKAKTKALKGELSVKKYTEYSRVVLALTALGENPEDFAGYDLVKPLSEFDNVMNQRLNGVVYALLALDSGDYKIKEPRKSYEGAKTTRERLVAVLVGMQLDDGGWNIIGSKAETDATAIVLQALAPYRDEEKVSKAVERGLNKLGKMQKQNGGYATGNTETAESTAQVLTALSVLKINIKDSRFVKSNNTVVDGLMEYYKDGGFKHVKEGNINKMATDQSFYSLVAYYRNVNDKKSLYNMSDGFQSKKVKYILNNADNISTQIKEENVVNKKDKKTKISNKKNDLPINKKDETGTLNSKKNEEKQKSTIEISTSKKTEKNTVIQTKANGETIIVPVETTKNNYTENKKEDSNKSYKAVIIGLASIIAIGAGCYYLYLKKGKK